MLNSCYDSCAGMSKFGVNLTFPVVLLSFRCGVAGGCHPRKRHTGVTQGAGRGHVGAVQGSGGQPQPQQQAGMLDHLSGIDFNQTLVRGQLFFVAVTCCVLARHICPSTERGSSTTCEA